MFRAVVGKLQYITGVRPDLMFATKCLSYELGSTHTCRSDTCQEIAEILERSTRPETPLDDTELETKRPVQEPETRHGIF